MLHRRARLALPAVPEHLPREGDDELGRRLLVGHVDEDERLRPQLFDDGDLAGDAFAPEGEMLGSGAQRVGAGERVGVLICGANADLRDFQDNENG